MSSQVGSLYSFEDSLRNSITISDLVRDISSRASLVIKDICEKLNLDRDVRVVISLRMFDEAVREGIKDELILPIKKVVCGYYDPQGKLIVISYPCVIARDNLSETIAHELIHHCQYTCYSGACRDICEVSLSTERYEEIITILPYSARPYEVEAYGKQEELAERIRGMKEYEEIENLIKRLHFTLNFNEEVKIRISKCITAHTLVLDNIFYAIQVTYLDTISAFLNIYVETFGKNAFLNMLEQIVKVYEEIVREAEQKIRECFSKRVKNLLSLDNPTSIVREEKFVRYIVDVLKTFFGHINAKLIVLNPRGKDILDLYIITDHGFTIYSINTFKYLPLIPLLLILPENTSIQEILRNSRLRLSLTLNQIIEGITRICLGSKNVESKVLLVKNTDVVVDTLKKSCREFRTSSSLDSLEFLTLISLPGWIPSKYTCSLQLSEFNNMIKVYCETQDAEEIGGILLCSDLKVGIKNIPRVHDEVEIRKAIEKLKNITHHKDFFENFIIKPLLHMILWNSYLKCKGI